MPTDWQGRPAKGKSNDLASAKVGCEMGKKKTRFQAGFNLLASIWHGS
jgi:hypothetical protein